METTVLIVDDHAILREGLRMVLESEPDIIVVGEAEDGRRGVEMVEQLHPDVVVMDIAMPNLNGVEATRRIKHHFPLTKVLILTMHEDRHYLAQIVKGGAIGVVLKRAAGVELLTAVKAAARGESYFSPAIATMMVEDYRLHLALEEHDEAETLTDREREVLQMVAEGKTNQEIANALMLSIKTVQTHRAHLMRKLAAHDRTDLVKFAIRQGLVTATQ